jgi:hypothetical protein
MSALVAGQGPPRHDYTSLLLLKPLQIAVISVVRQSECTRTLPKCAGKEKDTAMNLDAYHHQKARDNHIADSRKEKAFQTNKRELFQPITESSSRDERTAKVK